MFHDTDIRFGGFCAFVRCFRTPTSGRSLPRVGSQYRASDIPVASSGSAPNGPLGPLFLGVAEGRQDCFAAIPVKGLQHPQSGMPSIATVTVSSMRPGRSSPIFRTAESAFCRFRDFAIATRFPAAFRSRLPSSIPSRAPLVTKSCNTSAGRESPPFARLRPRIIDIRLEGTDIRFSEPGAAVRLLQHANDVRAHPYERPIHVREKRPRPQIPRLYTPTG